MYNIFWVLYIMYWVLYIMLCSTTSCHFD